jgi:methenyltetrahydromethanopterin cyclohydrolase
MSSTTTTTVLTLAPRFSINDHAAPLVRALLEQAASLRVGVERTPQGTAIVDAGIGQLGSLEAGLRIAEICMGGLGHARLTTDVSTPHWPWRVHVHASDPVLACLGSQLAGWSLSVGEGKQAYFALGSGPARALAGREALYKELEYRDASQTACLVLEVDKRPPQALIDKVVRDCGVEASGLTVVLTPTRSLAGGVQIVARSLEVALHKLHELHFPLERVVDGMGSAPVPPPGASFVEAMGRTNDAIIYGGYVQLYVTGPDEDAKQLAHDLPSVRSRDYGRPFAEIFKSYAGDFYKMDRLLFSPALVTVTALESGRSFTSGALNASLLDASFGASA